MKTAILSFLSISFLIATPDNPSITGKWQVFTSISGSDSDMTCTFAQKDDTLTGNCAGEKGTFEITGKVADGKVSWSYKTEYNGTPLTVRYGRRHDIGNQDQRERRRSGVQREWRFHGEPGS